MGLKRLGIALALVLVAMAALLAVLWSLRVEVVQGILDGVLAQRLGVPVEARVKRVEADGLAIDALRVGGDEGLRAERIELAYGLAGLLARRLDSIVVRGVRVQAAIDESGQLDLGPLQPLLEDSGGGGGGPLLLPAPRVSLSDVEARLETPRGPLEVSLRADLQEAAPSPETAPGSVVGEIRLRASHDEMGGEAVVTLSGPLEAPSGELSVRPRLSLPGLAIAGEPEIKGTFSLGAAGASGRVRVPGIAVHYRDGDLDVTATTPELRLAFAPEQGRTRLRAEGGGGALSAAAGRVEGLSLSLETDGEAISGRLAASQISQSEKPALVAPLKLDLSFEGSLDQLRLSGLAQDLKSRLRVDLSGTASPRALGARIDFSARPLEFGPGRADFARLFPSFAETFGQVSGRVAAHGTATLTDGAPGVQVDIALQDVDTVAGGASIRRVNGIVALEGYDPPVSRGDQLLSVGLVEAGLPLVDGVIQWRLLPGWVIDVPSATFAVAGGEIRCGVRLPLDEEDFELVLVALSLDLERLLDSVQFEGLAGSGTISGALPIEVRGDRVLMDGAILRGDAPGGTLRYRPDDSAAAVAGQQASTLGVAVQALSNLHWEVLELRLDGDTGESMEIGLSVSGSNPEFREGHPVQFNLNLEARLADLVKAGIESYRVPRAIEQRLGEFQRAGPKHDGPGPEGHDTGTDDE